jgi:hypothetical protein
VAVCIAERPRHWRPYYDRACIGRGRRRGRRLGATGRPAAAQTAVVDDTILLGPNSRIGLDRASAELAGLLYLVAEGCYAAVAGTNIYGRPVRVRFGDTTAAPWGGRQGLLPRSVGVRARSRARTPPCDLLSRGLSSPRGRAHCGRRLSSGAVQLSPSVPVAGSRPLCRAPVSGLVVAEAGSGCVYCCTSRRPSKTRERVGDRGSVLADDQRPRARRAPWLSPG